MNTSPAFNTRYRANQEAMAAQPIAKRLRSSDSKPNPAPPKKREIKDEFKRGGFDGPGDTRRLVCGNERLRNALLEEQGDECAGLLYPDGYVSCKLYPTDCDHIVELRHGGVDSVEYCQMLCHSCHRVKTKMNTRGQIIF